MPGLNILGTDATPDPVTDPTGNYTWNGSSWVPKTGITPGQYDAQGNYVPLVLAGGEHAASDTTAAILRGNYENWKNTYFPKIGELMQQTTYENPDLVGQETGKATAAVNSSFDTVQGGQQRNLARYGMTQTAEASDAMTTGMDLSKSAATVDAQNTTRQALVDRNRTIASGGLPKAVSGGS